MRNPEGSSVRNKSWHGWFKRNWFTFKGICSDKISFFYKEVCSNRRNLLPSLVSRFLKKEAEPLFRRWMVYRKASKKSQKLSPYQKWWNNLPSVVVNLNCSAVSRGKDPYYFNGERKPGLDCVSIQSDQDTYHFNWSFSIFCKTNTTEQSIALDKPFLNNEFILFQITTYKHMLWVLIC